jgi:hypothetical protein
MSEVSTVLAKPNEFTLTDGTVIQLQFTLYSFAVIEDEFGDLNEMQNAIAKGSIRVIGKLIAASIINDDVELTGDQVLKRLPLTDLNKIVKVLTDAMTDATGEVTQDTKDIATAENLTPPSEVDNFPGSASTTSAELSSDSVPVSSGA